MATTIACEKCDFCTDIELASDTNPQHCPECGGRLMLTAMGEVSDVPLYIGGELNPILHDKNDDGDWHATHRITFTPAGNSEPQVFDCMLCGGSLYTCDEWSANDNADWTIDDSGAVHWQGQSAPGNGIVCVSKID